MGKVLMSDIAQNEGDWIARKIDSIGSGDIATIAGANPYQTPLKLWAIKTRREAPDPENDFMWWGKQQERPIAELCARKFGLRLEYGNKLFGHDVVDWATATPDYFGTVEWSESKLVNAALGEVIPPDERIIVECKNISYRNRAAWEDETPLAPRLQVMWQLGVVGNMSRAVVAPLIGGDIVEFSPRVVDYSPEIFDQLLQLADKFMWYVKNDRPPPPKSEDTKLVDKIIGELEEHTVGLSDEHAPAIREYLALKNKIREGEVRRKELSDRADEIKNTLRFAMGKATRAECGGFAIKVTPVKVEPFMNKGSEYTRFTVKEETPK